MARCEYCGSEDLTWERIDLRWKLKEADNELHTCRPEDHAREQAKRDQERIENKEAARKYREANGYL
jgi:hypothetical protein